MEKKIKTAPEGIQRVVTITTLRDTKSDFAYWQAQSFLARLAALEQIRQEYHRWRHGAQPGFQRVYSIIKR
jgi:hypothetical protein